MFSWTLEQRPGPVPVQAAPPPGAPAEPAAGAPGGAERRRPYWSRSRYRPPSFLQHFPAPRGAPYNYVSFLGSLDPHGGKYQVPPSRLEAFLRPYFNTAHHTRRKLFLAECYNGQPYKYFQELDFPWSLDPALLAALVPRVVSIVTEEAAAAHGLRGSAAAAAAAPVVSMRTLFKVHLNFPALFTVEATARAVRRAVVNRCRAELSGLPPLAMLREEAALAAQVAEAQEALRRLQAVVAELEGAGQAVGGAAQQLLAVGLQPVGGAQGGGEQPQAEQQQPQAEQQQQQAEQQQQQQAQQQQSGVLPGAEALDWESIVDFPHGSLRLLGSCKAPWMDSDPEWVQEKCYSEAVLLRDGVWERQPLSFAAVARCSILLTATELRVFEQSPDFLEASYQAVDAREQLLAVKRSVRAINREIARLQAQQQGDGGAPQAGSGAAAQQAAAAGDAQQRPGGAAQQRREDKARAREAAAERAQQEERAAAAAEAERQRKKAAALAKLQAAAGTLPGRAAPSALARPGLARPGAAQQQ
ncbi:hypothetical protein HT031_002444 [Scenedesmus sp. PABB004]|nr:hypothetical protein HT031_002444 [Scenedesmus sp. PABB004]